MEHAIAFGPVPSRRLGNSLGINNIPPKVCSYACLYCQVGRTTEATLEPRDLFSTETIVAAARERLAAVAKSGEVVDYVTLVSDGEPTLDANLGETIRALKRLGPPVAVISNATLLWKPEVRQALMAADWVSLKVDAVDEAIWRRVDRPHGRLDLAQVQDGMRAFGADYRGRLVSETMLVNGVNDGRGHLLAVAGFLAELAPEIAYLAIPTRPPAESEVQPPSEARLNAAYQVLSERLTRVEYLVGYEGNAFGVSGDAAHDLLSITAVHPMREDAVAELLRRSDAEWALVDAMIANGQIVAVSHGEHRYYMRRLPSQRR